MEDWQSCRVCRVHPLDREMEEERVVNLREGKKNY